MQVEINNERDKKENGKERKQRKTHRQTKR